MDSIAIAPTLSHLIQPERLYLYPYSISPPKLWNTRNASLFLVHCSTKPGTDSHRPENLSAASANPSSNSEIQENEAPGTPKGIPSNSSNSRGLVFGLGLQNSWDSVEIGSPVVKRYLSDEGERWYLWYHGRSKGEKMEDSIGLAVSCNGIHWERGEGKVNSSIDVGLTMASSSDWWAFDTHGVRPREVVIMSSAKVRANNSLYWLYYTGSNGDKAALPGLAMSQDGRHWARIEGEHHSGALFSVGSEGEWDSLYIASPQAVYHENGDMRLYYHSFDQETGLFAVGIARSRDGIKWIKVGRVIIEGSRKGMFDELGMMNAYVVKDRKDGKYVMAYEGVDGDGRRSIGMATSCDGLKGWERVGDNGPLLGQCGEEGWDCEGVGCPCLVQMDGNGEEWRLYYSGFDKEGKTGIGLAVSQETGFGKFERWRGFHL